MKLREDELWWRFNAWLKVVIERDKIDYVRRIKQQKLKQQKTSNQAVDLCDDIIREVDGEIGFDFQNKELSQAFMKLSQQKRQVLELFFVQEYSYEEIANELHCSIRHVYNVKFLAIKELRDLLK